MNKSVLHSVFHVCAAALILTQMFVISDLRGTREFALHVAREAQLELQDALVLVIQARTICAAPEPKVAREQ